MFKNYIITSLRNILKYKIYSLINIAGLTIGITCTILIMLWVRDELSVDRYHEKADHIYHAYLKSYQGENIGYQSTTSPAIATILKTEYPEIVAAVRLGQVKEVVLKTDDKMILEDNGLAADANIFSMFTYPFVFGDPTTALNDPLSIVLTESLAKKYFNDANPLGQIIRIDDSWDVQVTGVMKDVPANSYLTFSFVMPFEFLKNFGQDIVGSPFFPCQYFTFVELAQNVSYQGLSDKIAKRLFSRGKMITFEICLIPFTKTYLHDTDGNTKIAILSGLALLILGLACINFTNLATARSVKRSREIGIRKVTGATRWQLARQFLSESTLMAFIAACLALNMIHFLLTKFNTITGKAITINPTDPVFLLSIIGLIALTGFAAGFYPALCLSRIQPVSILKKQSLGSSKSVLRRFLIVSQFVLSVALIVCTIVMTRQIDYLRNFNLGVNQNNILYVYLDGDIRQKFNLVKQELLENPNIEHVTAASNLPIAITSGSFFRWGKDDNVRRRMCATDVGYDYLDVFHLEMADGRFYSESYPNDELQAIVVNEAAIRAVGLESPVGKPFLFDGRYYTLIGVIKDFHHNKSLTGLPEPLSFWLKPNDNPYLFVKIIPDMNNIHSISETVQYVQTVCNRFSPERPLRYQFLSDYSMQFERSNQLMKTIVTYATVLAIFISCLGLFGLSLFVSEQKTKEIGVRKVLGASVIGVVGMLSKEFVRWVLLANIIAWPIAWYLMNQWLQNYAYRMSVSWVIFLAAGLLSLLIAILTVGGQALKAALANPVEALRYE